jgi:predicted PurR-regulated permease PerM
VKFAKGEIVNARTVANFTVVAASILLYFVVLNISNIGRAFGWLGTLLMPFIVGFIIAFFLNLPMRFFEKWLLYKIPEKRLKLKRALSILIVLAITLATIGFLFAMLIPELYESVVLLVERFPDYFASFTAFLESIAGYIGISWETVENMIPATESVVEQIVEFLGENVDAIQDIGGRFISAIVNAFLGLVISVYLLFDKEKLCAKLGRTLHGILPLRTARHTIETFRFANQVFSGFVMGKTIDSIAVGILCFVGMLLLRLEYVVLISVIIGVTNMIPIFGPFLGAIPSALILLIVSPMQAFLFLIFILLLQQFDGNIMAPKILSGSIGLPAFWVLTSLIIGGQLAGLMGLLFAVPTCAVLYALISRWLRGRLLGRDMPVEDKAYRPVQAASLSSPYADMREYWKRRYKEAKNKKKIKKQQKD